MPRRFVEERLAALPDAHRRGIERFRARLQEFVKDGLLNDGHASIIEEHLLRLGERNRNPANTGNLEDLFGYTLADTRDPVRAYAQVLADSVKIVPMEQSAPMVPQLKSLSTGQIFRTVGELTGFNPADQMLITHTMVAYGDSEMHASAAAFVAASKPHADPATIRRDVARMAVQSQHGPSSTFVLSRMRGLTLELEEVYLQAEYPEETIRDAQKFYDICASFDPAWVHPFLDGHIPTSPEWAAWRRGYLDQRAKLPEELVYQLSSDTLTNFFDGTLESGKWTDASILFGGVTDPQEIPKALARIVNQYIAEHMALHDRPSGELTSAVEEALEPWGVGFVSGRAVALPGAPKRLEQIRAQFDIAWARKVMKPKP